MNLFLIFITMSVQSRASYFARAEVLLRARSPAFLRKELINMDQADVLKKSCGLEKKENKVPSDCYRLTLLEERNKKISKNLFQAKILEYDKYCELAASSSTEIVETKGLSKSCAHLVSKRNKEILYSKE